MMRPASSLLLLSLLVIGVVGCGSSTPPPSADPPANAAQKAPGEAQNPPPTTNLSPAPPPDQHKDAPPPEPLTDRPAAYGKNLAEVLQGAARMEVEHFSHETRSVAAKVTVDQEAQVKSLLTAINPDQVLTGKAMGCPADFVIHVEDPEGKALGQVDVCGPTEGRKQPVVRFVMLDKGGIFGLDKANANKLVSDLAKLVGK